MIFLPVAILSNPITQILFSVYNTIAEGLAATAEGKEFGVVQEFGQGADVYLESAGAAVWQRAQAFGTLLTNQKSADAFAFPVEPDSAFFAQDALVQNGRGAANATKRTKVHSRNLYAMPYSPRSESTGPTITLYAADGPTMPNTATRAAFTTAAQLFVIYPSANRPRNGTYSIRFKVKSANATNYAIRYGSTTPGYLTATALAESWTTIELQYTITASAYTLFNITGDGTNLPDILIDEVQLYEAPLSEMPPFSAESFGDDYVFTPNYPVQRFNADKTLSNNTANRLGSGVLRVPTYPAAKTYNEITILIAVEMQQSAAAMVAIGTETLPGSTTNTTLTIQSQATVSGVLRNGYAFSGTLVEGEYDNLNQGIKIVAFRVSPTQRQAFMDGIEWATTPVAFSGFSARNFRFGSVGNNSILLTQRGTLSFQGRLAAAAIFDKALTDAEIVQSVNAIRSRLATVGIAAGETPYIAATLGDGQNTLTIDGARGPSWFPLLARGRFTPNMPCRVFSASAGGMPGNLVRNRDLFLPTILRMADQVNAYGNRKFFVCAAIFTADNGPIRNDPVAHWEQMKAEILAPIAAKGPNIVPFAVTATPRGDQDALFESGRLFYNNLIRSDIYRFIDFGGHPIMGVLANTSNPMYYDQTDQYHFSSGGQVLLAEVARAAIQAEIDAP